MTQVIVAFCNFANALKNVGGIGGVGARIFDLESTCRWVITMSANRIGGLLDSRTGLDVLEKRQICASSKIAPK